MKKMKKILIIISLVLMYTIIFSNIVSAEDQSDVYEDYESKKEEQQSEKKATKTIDEIIGEGQSFLERGKKNLGAVSTINGADLTKASDNIYNILLAIGIVITVIVSAYLGIQFMMSSVEGKAKIKESLVPFIIGCVIIYGGFGIWKITMSVVSVIEESYSVTEEEKK